LLRLKVKTMIKHFSEKADIAEIKKAFELMRENEQVQSVLLFMADSPEINISELDLLLKEFSKPIIGGIFPEIIFNNQRMQTGFYVIGTRNLMKAHLIHLDQQIDSMQLNLDDFASGVDQSSQTIWIFMDAFAEYKDDAINAIYDEFGPYKNYVGGGAGTLKLKSSPCVISNLGINQHCAVVAAMNCESSVGVAHGWQPITEPVKVTSTEGRSIRSFEWNSAFEYYQRIIKDHSSLEITVSNFFEIAKSYPLGLMKLNSEFIVRDPISTDGVNLNIIDLVPQNEFVQILNGNKESLFKGAATARKNAENLKTSDSFFFCIDCISRVLFLDEDFEKELKEISADDQMLGIVTIGEIANAGNSMLEIYNKTVVVCNISC